QDRARARPQPDCEDRHQAALPAAGTGKLIRRRPVRMAAMLVMHVACLAMRRIGMGVRMRMMIMLVMRMVMVRMIMVRMIVIVRVVVIMVVIMTMPVVVMVVAMMMVVRHGRRRAQSLRRAQERPLAHEGAALGVEQPRAHCGDQQVARDLDPPDRV